MLIHLFVLLLQFSAAVWVYATKSAGMYYFKKQILLPKILKDTEIFPCILNQVKSLFLSTTSNLINLALLCLYLREKKK